MSVFDLTFDLSVTPGTSANTHTTLNCPETQSCWETNLEFPASPSRYFAEISHRTLANLFTVSPERTYHTERSSRSAER